MRLNCLKTVLCICGFLFSNAVIGQANSDLTVNGVLFEVIPESDIGVKQEFLWSIELQKLSRDIEEIASSEQEKRLNVLFLTDKSGAQWRTYWSERVREVYATELGRVNDHAEGFFKITSGFPETFAKGDKFSIRTNVDGVTRVFINETLIAQSHKPDHFEFWLRAWNTGRAMPDIFVGNLLSGGAVDRYLLTAYQKSEAPKIAASEPEEVEVTQEPEPKQQDSYPAYSVKSVAEIAESEERVDAAPVVSVFLDNALQSW